jgi:hypothetical protein
MLAFRIHKTVITNLHTVHVDEPEKPQCAVEILLSDLGELESGAEGIHLRIVLSVDQHQPVAALQRAALRRAQELIAEQTQALQSLLNRSPG